MSLFNFGKVAASDSEDLINGLSMWASQMAMLGTADDTVDADPKPAAAVNFSLSDHAKKAAT